MPFTSNDESRIRIWNFVRKWWSDNFPYPIYVGESSGELFNISLARNRAAKAAGDWDVAIVLDADTLASPDQIEAAINLAIKTGGLVYPFKEHWNVAKPGVDILLAGDGESWREHSERFRHEQFGACAITRELWDLVRGFDPGFVGWGHEDGAFRLACEALSGIAPQHIEGKSLHLEHTPSESKKSSSPVYQANLKRLLRYQAAFKRPNTKELITALRDETIDIV